MTEEAETSAASSHDEVSDFDVDVDHENDPDVDVDVDVDADAEETAAAAAAAAAAGPGPGPVLGSGLNRSATDETNEDQRSLHQDAQGAGRKRKRSKHEKTSCELCKARKVKCDRAEPACSWCAQHNRACVYLERQRPGSRILLRSQLEAKVNRLEALLQSLGRRVEEHIASDHVVVPAHAQGPSPAISSHVPSPIEPHQHQHQQPHQHPYQLQQHHHHLHQQQQQQQQQQDPGRTGTGMGMGMGMGTGTGLGLSSGMGMGMGMGVGMGMGLGNTSSAPLQLPLPPLSTLSPASTSTQGPYARASSLNGGMRTSVSSQAQATFPTTSSAGGLHAEPRRGPTPLSAINDFPPHDIVFAIVDLYFKHCNPWCPILDRKTIFGTFFGSTSVHEPDRVLLHAIIATTLRFLKDPRMSPEMKAHQHAVSRQAVHKYTSENMSIPSLRALVILSLDELGRASGGPRSWNMLALLAQNVTQLGLCEERAVYLSLEDPIAGGGGGGVGRSALAGLSSLSSLYSSSSSLSSARRVSFAGQPESWTEDEGRRRLCWMVYLLDRYATIATTSLGFLLDDARMRRALPCSYDLFSSDVPVETRSWLPAARPYGTTGYATNKPENLGSFSYHCEILRILSRVHDFLRAPLDASSAPEVAAWRATYRSLNAALDGWLASLPSDYSKISALCHSDPGSRVANWFMLHGAYVTAVVRLHSAAAYPHPPLRTRLFEPSYHATQRCLSAVQSLADITRDVFEASGLESLGPPFVFALWVAARLLLVHAAAVGAPPDPQIDFFIDILDHISQYWEIASHYSRILARAVQRSRQGDMSLTAMRRNAHELSALTMSSKQSVLEPTTTRVISSSELDSIDIFDFFNVPKSVDGGSDSSASRLASGDLRMPNPDDDWLSSPFD